LTFFRPPCLTYVKADEAALLPYKAAIDIAAAIELGLEQSPIWLMLATAEFVRLEGTSAALTIEDSPLKRLYILQR